MLSTTKTKLLQHKWNWTWWFGGRGGKSSCKHKMKTNMTNKKRERAKNSFKQKQIWTWQITRGELLQQRWKQTRWIGNGGRLGAPTNKRQIWKQWTMKNQMWYKLGSNQ